MKIVLIGFMGSGKTSISKILAKELNLEIVDMDSVIVQKSGRKSDREIFDLDGEKKFRELERNVAFELKNINNVVISTGGGVIMNEQNMANLKHSAIVIYLKTTFETSKKRISKKNPPPLFRNEDKARKLYSLRKPLYEKFADLVVSTDRRDKDEIAMEIIELLN
jgi:shikimate kinase